MARIYSIYEAKTHFSKIMERVRGGESVTISYHGTPVAEIRPIQPEGETFEERLARMEREGTLVRPKGPRVPWTIGEHVPGAYQRWLDDRDE